MSLFVDHQDILQDLATVYIVEHETWFLQSAEMETAQNIEVLLDEAICFQDEFGHMMNWVWIYVLFQTIYVKINSFDYSYLIGVLEKKIKEIRVNIPVNIYCIQIVHLCLQECL